MQFEDIEITPHIEGLELNANVMYFISINYVNIFAAILLASTTAASGIVWKVGLHQKELRKKDKKKFERSIIRVYINKKPNTEYYLVTTNRPHLNTKVGLMTILAFDPQRYQEGYSQGFGGILVHQDQITVVGARNRVLPLDIGAANPLVVSGDYTNLRHGPSGGILSHSKRIFETLFPRS